MFSIRASLADISDIVQQNNPFSPDTRSYQKQIVRIIPPRK